MNYLQKKKMAMMNSVASGGRLPSEYQECEYIESNGQQYIDSGIKLQFEYGFDVKFYTKSNVGGTQYGCIFGGRNSTGDRDYQLTSYDNYIHTGSVRWGGAEAGPSGAQPYIVQYTIQECSLHNGVFTDCNGNTKILTKTHIECPVNAYLFGLNNDGRFIQSGSGCRIYYLKIYDDTDSLIRDFIPCYRKSDNEIGMYDTVNDTFYTNQGSGTFTKGGDV